MVVKGARAELGVVLMVGDDDIVEMLQGVADLHK